jgi:hypothetical protein
VGRLVVGSGEQRVAAMAVATSSCFPRSSIVHRDEQPMNECVLEDDESVSGRYWQFLRRLDESMSLPARE